MSHQHCSYSVHQDGVGMTHKNNITQRLIVTNNAHFVKGIWSFFCISKVVVIVPQFHYIFRNYAYLCILTHGNITIHYAGHLINFCAMDNVSLNRYIQVELYQKPQCKVNYNTQWLVNNILSTATINEQFCSVVCFSNARQHECFNRAVFIIVGVIITKCMHPFK